MDQRDLSVSPRRRLPRRPRGLPLRAVAPNAVTALALCSGLSGVRFAIGGEWQSAVAMIMVAGVLDGLDGRIARLLHGESRFGAELDSLSDAISFGVAPALIMYLWSLAALPRLGWISSLILAVFCALRLARFNAKIDETDQPHKSAGFLTGVPAPAGAGLAMLPMYFWFWTDHPFFASPWLVAPWVAFIALLMVSSVATFSWTSLKLRRTVRFEAIAGVVLLGAALVSAPWHTLSAICVGYLVTIPFSMASYARVKRLRATGERPRGSEPTPSA
ncbi:MULTISPECIES: phosphatidylcholine/phosphatidylserine synthase [unclassified Sphingomonas]|jgi:CDP-diacylglycerol--serine O-phosphatidyltransferase|uniref:CDP-alcohol phosphatidyltransferase family protein n=1 Tax=unclassified Sphingomonas TaxID=196159 RepID=UPI0025FB6660|nr:MULTISPECIES: phosphatidylcholine/phosphatidylserine synthase [unclassified Sphingomonas]